MRAAIRLAGGREVCFVCAVDADGRLTSARAVARGTAGEVLALPGVAQRGEMLVHNHPSGWLEPSDADLNIAARLHDDGVGFGITDNDVTDLYVVTEVPRVAPKTCRAGVGDRTDDFGPDGPLAQWIRVRTKRATASATWRRRIARTYADGGVALLEAGTGVGKSLAYLVPALRWAAANKERTVVSTNTITLQEQLVGKDLPLLADLLSDQPVRFALLKGWRNYLCLSRLAQAEAGERVAVRGAAAGRAAHAFGEWAKATQDGSLSDLPTPPRPDVWDEVAAEPDLCTRLKCPHFDACFVFKARRARRDGGRRGREPLAAAGRHRRAARITELGGGGGAAGLLASGGGRRAPSRRRGGESPRQQRVESRRVEAAESARTARRSRGEGPAAHARDATDGAR